MAIPVAVVPFLPVIAKFLAFVVAGLAFRVLSAIGFGYVSYVGIGELVGSSESYIQSLLQSLPTDVAAILGLAKIDVCLNILVSAQISALLLAGMDKLTGTITGMALLNKASGQ